MFTIRVLQGSWVKDDIINHLLSLDEQSNRLRFGVFMKEESIRKYVDSIDFNIDRLYGAYDDTLKLIGVIHIAWMKKSGCAEIGISVDPMVQRGGIGGRLFKKAINYARTHGANKLYSFCLIENIAMMHMARKENMKIERIADEAEAHMVIDPATPQVYFNEYSDDIISNAEFLHKYINNVYVQLTNDFNSKLEEYAKRFNEIGKIGKPIS